jgi:hypothetical protein
MEGTRQEVKRFLFEKAQEFIKKSQAVPCTRASRRKAAREIAKRYMQNIRAEEAQNAHV